MNGKELFPLVVFVGLLVIAILVGNALLVAVLQRPIDQVPNFLKFIVHGISLTFIAVLAKKYFLK